VSEGTAFLALTGVAKSFGDHVAVNEIDLEIARGEFVTLLGPSGCGKTTLLRLLAGFEQPTAGSILLDGQDLTRLPPERRPLNLVFQSYALFPHMSVFENVAYGLRNKGLPDREIAQRVGASLELVGLQGAADRRVQELSGGMSQRVALIRAIVNEPDVLLLDEPLGALDLKLRKRMQVELRAIQERLGTTFVYVTHDQEEALVLSHRVVVMNEGSIVQVGSPDDVYHRPVDRFVADFVGESSFLDAVVERAHDQGDVVVSLAGLGAPIAVGYHGDAPLERGEPRQVALRPEHLRLAQAGGPLRGTVSDAIFIGSRVDVLVVLADGRTSLRVALTNGSPPRRGETVTIDVVPGKGALV
jgi:spermidine/putrescine transport system ATP-binding protein